MAKRLIGPGHARLDAHSGRPETCALVEVFTQLLGPPRTGPDPIAVGELMDTIGEEVPRNTTWRFPAEQQA